MNSEIEKRIKQRKEHDEKYGINSYGGMGMDGISKEERALRMEEINYLQEKKSLPMVDLIGVIKKTSSPRETTTLLQMYNSIMMDQGHYYHLALIVQPFLREYGNYTLKSILVQFDI